MANAILEVPTKQINSYAELRNTVAKTFFESQKKIEALKVQTYWQTGKFIADYLKKHPGEREGKKSVLTRLSEDLKLERSLFFRMFQFANAYPSVVPRRQLSWTHYRALMTVQNPGLRKQLTKQAAQEKWRVLKLRDEIKRRVTARSAKRIAIPTLIEPEYPVPGTRKVGWLKTRYRKRKIAVDLGFSMYAPLPSKRFQAGDAVVFNKGKWQKAKAGSRIYDYQAQLEKVVDGDTLLVHLQLTPETTKRQYLRLRGVDAAPLETRSGEKAQSFLEKLLRKTSGKLVFHSRELDRYDRAISDVWAGTIYLNQAILNAGNARLSR